MNIVEKQPYNKLIQIISNQYNKIIRKATLYFIAWMNTKKFSII
jgi:hypothetical protein